MSIERVGAARDGVVSARVETLRAEVRVLMIGSRQVTLSMARQLDVVKLEEMEPFGRVRIKDGNWVIGRSLVDGSLVLARYQKPPLPLIGEEDIQGLGPVVVCGQYLRLLRPIRVHFGDRLVEFERKACTPCDKDGKCVFDHCPSADLGKCVEAIQKAIDEQGAAWAKYEYASNLPLIVLAGLK